MDDLAQAQAVEYRRKWHVMATVGTGILIATLDGSIVNVALPTLVREFNSNFPTVQWVVLAYLLTLATLMLSVGRLGDMVGKKGLYGTGFAIFTVGSACCGWAPSISWLIAFRVLQAIGATMMTSLGMAIVTEAFPPSQRGMALGISGSIVSIGTISGPVLGGILIDALSWHWIFFVNLPIGILGIFLVSLFVPKLQPQKDQRFDGLGAILLFLSVLSFLLALTFGQQIGFSEIRILLLFCGWVLFLFLFLIQERIKDQPMIDLRFFKNPRFSIGLISGFGVFIALAGTTILMPFYLENVLGFEPKSVGLLMATVPGLLGIFAPISGFLSDRVGSRPITLLGLLVLLLGYSAVSTLNSKTSILGYVLRFLPIGIGMGIFQSPNNSAIMGSMTSTRLGVASGMLALTRTLGQTTGIALLGAIWASRLHYYQQVGLSVDAQLNSRVVQVTALRDTFIYVVILIFITLLVVLVGALLERNSIKSHQNPSYT